MSYHTVNIKKKYYQKIQEQAQKGIFGNTKAYILHSIANQITKDTAENKAEQDLGIKALQILKQDPEIKDKKITDALQKAANQKLEQD